MEQQRSVDAALAFPGSGEIAAQMRAMDWAQTRLGPVDRWPGSLRTMLGVILGSRFPMMIWWGPELLNFYNDAYRPILRDKHPKSLAAPAAEVWAEIWDFARPLAKGVMDGGPATWMEDVQLFIKSGAISEETYFTFSYSPIPGEDGKVGGLLNTVQETTVKVQGERQIRMLRDLAARTATAKSEDEAWRIVAEVLSANELDIPFVQLLVMDEKDGRARVAASGGAQWNGRPHLNGGTNGQDWPCAEALREGREIMVDGLAARFGELPAGKWGGRPDKAILLPLPRPGQTGPQAFLAAGISPHRAFDDRYRRFFMATADQSANVVANARAFELEKNRAEALAELDRAKTVFFNNISHEFRTPLTLILGPIEDALNAAPKELAGEELAAVHRNAVRLLRLVNNLLDFSRLEAGRIKASFSPVDLARLTAGLAGSFSSLIEGAGLRLAVDCPPLPEQVYVDPELWEKMVLNLISNAFKFTFQGEIRVSLLWRTDHVELSVKDTGTGIPDAELPRIFERFHRVEGAKGRSFEGSGIGLALVQELAVLHGGSVRVTSEMGKGSEFVVSIPAGFSHLPAEQIATGGKEATSRAAHVSSYFQEAVPRAMAGGVASLPAAPRGPNRKDRRILVVDDNADMREYLVRLLSEHWAVEAAEDGLAALALVRTKAPDLVLSDIMMPVMDGVALLRELRADPRTREIPVVLLSARAGEETVLEGLDTGADDYLVKPFSARELIARVRTHVEIARIRRKTALELESANRELEAFNYSVSHDLRAPIRAIEGFSRIMLEDYSAKLDDDGKRTLQRICNGTQRMKQLVDDLLTLSRYSRGELRRVRADLSAIALAVIEELRKEEPGRTVEIAIAPGMEVHGDLGLLRAVLDNLLRNAWKFTSKHPGAKIEVGTEPSEESKRVFFVRDDGAGFDMEHAQKLFAPFQRLHSESEYTGTGIGLSIVRRIVNRHGGRIWAEGAVNGGATFRFTLGE